MKEGLILSGIAFLLTVMVFAGFTNPVFALTDFDSDWSTDDTAYAAVTGTYTSIGSPYSNQAHKGEITEGNVWRDAFTRFTQKDLDGDPVTDPATFYLQNYTSKSKSYSYGGVYFIETVTDSGYGTIPQSRVTVEIGPPGVE